MTPTHSAAREQVGLVLTGGFVLCGALRDVYFSRTLQTWSPLDIAALTFTISTLVFLTVAMVRGGRDLMALTRWPREIAQELNEPFTTDQAPLLSLELDIQ